MNVTGPHAGQPVLSVGKPLDQAKYAVIMIHGRGTSAQSILQLASVFGDRTDMVYLAPQASGFAWYPNRFIAPIQSNEPYLSSALQLVGGLVSHLQENDIPPERQVLLGFSQGACLALEFAARNPQRYGGVVGYSGGLIGPEGMKFSYPGSLEGTPVFMGCSDVDFHIPLTRVNESAEVLSQMGAKVDERIYPGMDHTINDDEIAAVNAMLDSLQSTL